MPLMHAWLMFANDMLQKLDTCEFDAGNIWFIHKEGFFLDGFVHKQNWCIWGRENSHVAVPSSLYPPKVIIWTIIFSRGSIEPFLTITTTKYLAILHVFEWAFKMLSKTKRIACYLCKMVHGWLSGCNFLFSQHTFQCSCHCPRLRKI